jgi:hypothetical protein
MAELENQGAARSSPSTSLLKVAQEASSSRASSTLSRRSPKPSTIPSRIGGNAGVSAARNTRSRRAINGSTICRHPLPAIGATDARLATVASTSRCRVIA